MCYNLCHTYNFYYPYLIDITNKLIRSYYMKSCLYLLVIGILASTTVNSQTVVPTTGNPMGTGSWLKFESGSNQTSIIESWGLNITGLTPQPVKIAQASLLVGYTSNGNEMGVGNLFVNGNIGAGTTNPAGKLHIVGNQQSKTFNSSAIVAEQTYVDLGNNNLIGATTLFKTNNSSNSWTTGLIAGTMGTPNNIGGYPGGLAFYTKSADNQTTSVPTERMRIDHRGYVGIGTASPQEALSVKWERARPRNKG